MCCCLQHLSQKTAGEEKCASAYHLPGARNLSLSAAQHQQLPKNHNEFINGAEKQPIRASLLVKTSFVFPNCPQYLSIQLSTSSWRASPSEGKRGSEGQVHRSLLRPPLAWRTCLSSLVTSRSAASPSNSWSSDLSLQLEWSPGTRKAPKAGRDKALLVLLGAGRIQLTRPRAASCCQSAEQHLHWCCSDPQPGKPRAPQGVSALGSPHWWLEELLCSI